MQIDIEREIGLMSEGLSRDYTICEEIGRGRFGVVRRCFSPRSGHSFAVKSVDKTFVAGDPIDRQCLENEAKVMQILTPHPHVVRVYDVFEDEAYVHIVAELCGGGDLFGRIASTGRFSEEQAVAVMVPLMEAIAHCHRMGVAHRDIKPDNILFNSHGHLKLADFGSADFFRPGENMSGVVGTPYYIAPEVLQGRDYTEKVDVWSAGVILYLMLAGVPPFYGETAEEIFESVIRGNLRFPPRVFGTVSHAVKDLLRRMICRDGFRRFSAQQALDHPWMTQGRAAQPNLDQPTQPNTDLPREVVSRTDSEIIGHLNQEFCTLHMWNQVSG